MGSVSARAIGRRRVGLVAVVMFAITLPAAADADVRSATADDPQDAPATVSGQPNNPDIKRVQATYDTAGTLTLTIDFFNAASAIDYSQNYAFWATFTVGTWTDNGGSTDSCSTSQQGSLSGQHHVGGHYVTFYDRATVSGYEGYLNFSRSTSADGKQVTITASNPNIANRGYNCIEYTLHARRRSTVSNPNSDYDSGCDCWYVGIRIDTTGEGATSDTSRPTYFAGFTPPEKPACRDGRDNDGDGKSDWPGDPDCSSSNDSTEQPPVCQDKADNDGDGRIDADDWGCRSGDTETLSVLPSYKAASAQKDLRGVLAERFRKLGSTYEPRCRRRSATKFVCRPKWLSGSSRSFSGKVTLWLKQDGETLGMSWRGKIRRVDKRCLARKRAGDPAYRSRTCVREYDLVGTREL